IDWTGLIQVEARDALPPGLSERVVVRGEERQVVVLRPGEAGARQEIVLTQDDVRQVQLAKGAIASGVMMLQHVAGVPSEVVAVSTSLDARWLMAYSAALGLDEPWYYNTQAPAGPVAHPLFSVCYEWPAVLALRAKTVNETLALLAVHATHHVTIHRLPTAEDRLLTRAQVIEVRPSRVGTLYVARVSTVDRNGRPVA